jgi:hypothetical protein
VCVCVLWSSHRRASRSAPPRIKLAIWRSSALRARRVTLAATPRRARSPRTAACSRTTAATTAASRPRCRALRMPPPPPPWPRPEPTTAADAAPSRSQAARSRRSLAACRRARRPRTPACSRSTAATKRRSCMQACMQRAPTGSAGQLVLLSPVPPPARATQTIESTGGTPQSIDQPTNSCHTAATASAASCRSTWRRRHDTPSRAAAA